MSKKHIGIAVTALLIVVSAGTALRLDAKYKAEQSAEPQDTVYAMWNAARCGDVAAYLAAYTGDLRKSLETTASDASAGEFARYLRETNQGVKGIAVYDPEDSAAGEAKVRVEYVYQDRNDTQTMYLKRVGREWKITRLDQDQRIRTLIPYGTPIK